MRASKGSPFLVRPWAGLLRLGFSHLPTVSLHPWPEERLVPVSDNIFCRVTFLVGCGGGGR